MTDERNHRDRYCFACQRKYESRVGTFSESWICKECERPICSLCWSTGLRFCHEHDDIVSPENKGEDNVDPEEAETNHADTPDEERTDQE